MLTPLTTTLCLSGRVRSTSPCLPLSLPATTITGSPGARSSQRRLGCSLFLSMCFLENLWCEGDDLHEVALAQLAGDRTEDTSPPRVVGLGQQYRGVLVEPDQRPVRPLVLLVHAHDDSLHDLALLDLAAGLRRLHSARDDVADVGVAAVMPARNADHEQLLRAGVVRNLEAGFLLDHYLAFSTISSTRQRFSLEMGRVSAMRTRSPTPASFFSSWTLNFVRCCTVLRYS